MITASPVTEKAKFCSMEIVKPRIDSGRLLNLRITQRPLGCEKPDRFKCCIMIYA